MSDDDKIFRAKDLKEVEKLRKIIEDESKSDAVRDKAARDMLQGQYGLSK
jgi:hypothetical protein